MEPIILRYMPPERYGQMCYICERNGRGVKATYGVCTKCNKPECQLTFHPTCAQPLNLLREEEGSLENINYCGYCEEHIAELGVASKQISPSTKRLNPAECASNSPSKFNDIPLSSNRRGRRRKKSGKKTDDVKQLNVMGNPKIKLEPLDSDDDNGASNMSAYCGNIDSKRVKVGSLSDSEYTEDNLDGAALREGDSSGQKIFEEALTAPHMLGNQLNPLSSMAQQMSDTLFAEIKDHSICTDYKDNDKKLVGPPLYHRVISNLGAEQNEQNASSSNSKSVDEGLELLLEKKWENGNLPFPQRGDHFDVVSLLTGLYQIDTENKRLENVMKVLQEQIDTLEGENQKMEEFIQAETSLFGEDIAKEFKSETIQNAANASIPSAGGTTNMSLNGTDKTRSPPSNKLTDSSKHQLHYYGQDRQLSQTFFTQEQNGQASLVMTAKSQLRK